MAADEGRIEKTLTSIMDNGSRLQGPAVDKYVWRLRRAHPQDSPAQIIERMEKLFVSAVTGSGSAAGAAAAIPGIGTIASVAAVGSETAFFVEASALLALATASVHGISIHDHQQRRALVLAVALGESGLDIVQKTLGGTGHNVGRLITGRVGGGNLGSLNKTLMKKFITKYAAKRGALSLGTMLPAGVGAVIGGVGNRSLGKGVVRNARETFGPPPTSWATAPGVIDEE